MKKIILVLLLITLVACNQQSSQNLKVGVLIPLTGPASSLGEDFVNGMMLAKEDLNSNVEIIIQDSQTNPKNAVNAAKKMFEIDNIDILVTVQATVAIPVLSVADQYNKPLLASIVAQNEFAKKSENAFLIYPLPEYTTGLAARFAYENNFEKVAIMTLLDEYGESMTREFTKAFHGEIVVVERFEKTEVDYRTSLLKIKEHNPDLIFFIGYSSHHVRFHQQREELGISTPVISNVNAQDEFVKSQIDASLLENVYAVTPMSALSNDKTIEFRKEYEEKYSEVVDWPAPYGYDTMLVLDSVSKGTHLENTDILGLNGEIEFNEYGEDHIPHVIVKADGREIIAEN